MLREFLGINLIVTVQREEGECVADIRKYCKKYGLKHWHIELEGANQALLGDKKIQKRVKADVKKLFKYLCNNEC